MTQRIPFVILIVAALLPRPSPAEEGAFRPVPAEQVVTEELLFLKRPVIVFADSPNDPSFIQQMESIDRNPAPLSERDVIVITDTDPAHPSALRRKLRPRGFGLVLMDKDWQPEIRKPLPWEVREISNAIDKFPLRRQELTERPAAGG